MANQSNDLRNEQRARRDSILTNKYKATNELWPGSHRNGINAIGGGPNYALLLQAINFIVTNFFFGQIDQRGNCNSQGYG